MQILQQISNTMACGVFGCLTGLLLCYRIGRRRFNRRGLGGLQHYNSYGGAVATTIIEKLLNSIGIAAIIIGLLLMLSDKGNHHRPAEKKQPAQIFKHKK